MLEYSVSVLWFVCFCLAFLDAQLSLATSCVRRLKWNEAVDKVGFSVGWGGRGPGGLHACFITAAENDVQMQFNKEKYMCTRRGDD